MSKSAPKNNNIQFGLRSIELLDVQITHPNRALPSEQLFNFDVEINHRFNINLELIFVITQIYISTEDETNVGKIRTSCIYNVTKFKNFVNEKNEVKLPTDILTSLNSISISTTRGMMFSLTKGTFLHSALLPLIDPTAFRSK